MPRFAGLFATTVAAALLAGCSTLPPQGRTPFAPTEAMRNVLSERASMHAKEKSSISVQEARDVPSLLEAAQAIQNVQGLPATGIEITQFNQPTASGAAGAIGASLFRPAMAKDTPVIIYFPGGTWATRRDADADEIARQLATRTGWIVVSLRPRLAPEAPFPAIHDDAVAAYQWARSQLRAWGGDPTRVVLAGDGPGANLALSTALEARDHRQPLPDALVLITPWAGTSTSSPSMSENGRSRPLTRATVRWAQNLYAPDNLRDRRIDLENRTDLSGMPKTMFVLADIDPLRSGAETLAARMQQAGVTVDVRRYSGVTYDFFGLGAYIPAAAKAENDVAQVLKAELDRPLPPPPPRRRVSRSRAPR